MPSLVQADADQQTTGGKSASRRREPGRLHPSCTPVESQRRSSGSTPAQLEHLVRVRRSCQYSGQHGQPRQRRPNLPARVPSRCARRPCCRVRPPRERRPACRSPRPTDIRIVEVEHRFEEFRYRAPYQFGGRTVDRVTLAQRRVPGPHRRRQGGVGLRVDDARQRLGLSRGSARHRAGRDDRAGGRTARADRGRATRAAIRSICSARSSRRTCVRPTRCRADARCPCRFRSCARWSSPARLTPPSTTRTARPSA